jgi:hypothetical protein
MAKQTKKTKEIEMTIKMKGSEPLTFQDSDLKQICWEYIFTLEKLNPQTLEEFGGLDALDHLLQNYFTLKLLYTEQNLETTDEMNNIEDFITKYLKRFFAVIHLEELKNLPPAFQLNEN